VTELLVPCRRCHRQVPSTRLQDQVCADCRVQFGLADLRKELGRLWRKRERYSAHHASTASIDRQIERVQLKVAERIESLLPGHPEEWMPQFEATMERARADRYDLRSLH
jgi:hypothetical protein